MNTNYYIEKAIKNGNFKVQKLYKKIDRPLTHVEMRLITRLDGITEALEHEYEDGLGFTSEYRTIIRHYNEVNRLLARLCKEVNHHRKVLKSVDFHQYDQYL